MTLGMALTFYMCVVKMLKLLARKFYGLIPLFVGAIAEKLVGGLFTRGTEFIQNFHKGKIYLIGENFVGKKYSSGKIFIT